MSTSDSFAVRVVVVTLALISVGGAITLGALAFSEKAIPDQLDRLIAGAVGALVGLIAATRTGATETQPVQVVNEGPAEAVPVAENPAP